MAKFGEKSIWEVNVVQSRHGCGLWKSICGVRDLFWKHVCFRVGSGREIRFWNDRWVGEVPLMEAFRSLYGLALEPDGLVGGSFDYEGNIWIPKLRRNLNDWEVDDMARLFSWLIRLGQILS